MSATTSSPQHNLIHAIDEASEDLRAINLTIHDNPELGYQEVIAHKTLTEYLINQGFKVTTHACGLETAFIAEFVNNPSHLTLDKLPAVGICSEYDALPGIGHGCGHNLIAVAGVATAIGLQSAIANSSIGGIIRLFGTPAEETTGGKIILLHKGAFNHLDICMMAHGGPKDIRYRQPLGVGRLEIEFFGKSSHASTSPWKGQNALDAFSSCYNWLGLLRQQTLPTNRIHCIVTKGGDAANIIPDHVTGVIMYRAMERSDFMALHDKILEIVQAAADSNECEFRVEKTMEYLPLSNNSLLMDRLGNHMESMGTTYMSREKEESVPAGSTDMGTITVAMPGIHPVFNITSLDSVSDSTLFTHSIRFASLAREEIAHKTAMRVGKGMALTGLDVLMDSEYRKAIKDEFNRSPGKALGTLMGIQYKDERIVNTVGQLPTAQTVAQLDSGCGGC